MYYRRAADAVFPDIRTSGKYLDRTWVLPSIESVLKEYKLMKPFLFLLVVTLSTTALLSDTAWAQAPAAGASPPANASPVLSSDKLENLVGRIALYPDELIGIVLPASTYPLQIVQASRFLENKKNNPELKPRESWDTSVLGLLNYPEVIKMMSEDLDWIAQLGDAVVAQQKDVMDAIQHFRTRTHAAGNLKTDDKQIIVQEKQTIIIKSANPEVIYIPHYQPQVVVVAQTYPPIVYYPTPYPVYYSPAATFYTGMFVGAAIAYGVGWHNHDIHHYNHHGHHGDVNINKNTNVNINKGNRQSWKPGAGSGSRPGYRPGTNPGNRPGNAPNRFRTQTSPRTKAQSARPFTGQGSNRFANQSRGRSSNSGAFSGYGRGRNQSYFGNRGRQSRSSMNKGNWGSRSSGRSFGGGGGGRRGGRR